MARLSRLAGAIVVETESRHFLLGNPKEPCDWAARGFVAPPLNEAGAPHYFELRALNKPELRGPFLSVETEGSELLQRLAQRLLIQRNGSVSERLWNLICGDEHTAKADCEIGARWLTEMPSEIWRIVQDTVLRCS